MADTMFVMRISALMIAAVSIGWLASCKTSQTPVSSTWRSRGDVANASNGSTRQPGNLTADTRNSWVRTAVTPLGVIPYDSASLPLVSPNGQFIATQTGIAPPWSTVTAGSQAEVPTLTSIEVYELDARDNLANDARRTPQLLYTVSEHALLGRSSDGEGFLIESPREDGSRWIGWASWATGEITWVADDHHVNAFASIGPDGRMAWSRRAVDSQHFELVVRRSEGEWVHAAADSEDWLMPQWSGRGDGLFCLHLASGELEIVFANVASAEAFRMSARPYPLGPDATVATAYQSLTGQVPPAEWSTSGRDQLLYFHPWLERMALWRPLAGPGRTAVSLNVGSFMAVLSEDDVAIVATDEELIRQRLSNPRDQIDVLKGTHAIRPTPASPWTYVLLSPGEGNMSLLGLKMLPISDATAVGP